VKPIELPSNQPADRFYLGGPRIAEFRGEAPKGSRVPEDWVASTTTIAGETEVGLTVLPGGTRLVDAIAASPAAWLGDEHVARYGVDTKLLVKLLDAGQRLPVHAHPHAAFAREHLGRHHGKAEAWFILEGGDVFLGLTRDVPAEELAALVDSQNTERMLDLLHRRRVEPGDTVYVPPGVLHAIGEGVLLAEVQEPEDLSILLEWRGFELDGRAHGHLGLGFAVALAAVDRSALSAADVDALITRTPSGASILPAASSGYFRLAHERVTGRIELERGFAILVVTSGALRLEWDHGSMAVQRGSTVVVPFALGPSSVSGAGDLLIFRPPTANDAPEDRTR
jgi:mannose-6-phosphate isomerase